MAQDYLYSGTRAKTLERKLLSETQLELLTSAKSISEVHKVLYDTYLASFLTKDPSDADITRAIDQSIQEAKETLVAIAPDPSLLDVLWIKYDVHNSKAIVKAAKIGTTDDALLAQMSSIGTVSPTALLAAYRSGTLAHIDPILAEGVAAALQATNPFAIDATLNRAYARIISTRASVGQDSFVMRYVSQLIDSLNLKAAFRVHTREAYALDEVFLDGGAITRDDLHTYEASLACVRRFDHAARWLEAIKLTEETESTTGLERAADEQLNDFVRTESTSVFTLASLFSYFAAHKNCAQTIGAIVVAKQSSMPERELRIILRRLYA